MGATGSRLLPAGSSTPAAGSSKSYSISSNSTTAAAAAAAAGRSMSRSLSDGNAYAAAAAGRGLGRSLSSGHAPVVAAAAAAAGFGLFEAISAGDAQQVALRLQQGADVNSMNKDGQCMLAVAVQQLTGQAMQQVLDTLLANPCVALESYAAALHVAAASNQQALQHLLSRQQLAEQAVNMRDVEGRTALHAAALADNAEGIRLLLQVPGAEPNIADEYGFTPLHAAVTAEGDQLQALETLLESDAPRCDRSPGSLDEPGQFEQLTPLHFVMVAPDCRNPRRAVQLLVAAGADPSARARAVVNSPWTLELEMVGGQNVLHCAALATPLGIDGLDELLLVSAGGTATASAKGAGSLLAMADDQGNTALHRAIIRRNVAAVQRLLAEPGCNPCAAGNSGWTPLHHAAFFCPEAVSMLLEHPAVSEAAANARSFGGMTQLHVAAGSLRDIPEARASLGLLLANDKVDSSLTAVLPTGLELSWAEMVKQHPITESDSALAVGATRLRLRWVAGELISRLQDGAGQLLFSIYLLTVLSGFGDAMSPALCWLSWLLLAAHVCLVYAVRPQAEALECRAAHLGLSGRVWCLNHLESSYHIAKLLLASALAIWVLALDAGNSRMQW